MEDLEDDLKDFSDEEIFEDRGEMETDLPHDPEEPSLPPSTDKNLFPLNTNHQQLNYHNLNHPRSTSKKFKPSSEPSDSASSSDTLTYDNFLSTIERILVNNLRLIWNICSKVSSENI
ncbi:hypothetical protein Tco_0060771 [Tanacetum coccineum]